MLGLTMTEPGAALRKHLRLEAGEASMITSVLEGFPAYQAGLEEYDVIVEIEGAENADPGSIREALMERGLLSKETHETVVRLAPPLTIRKAEVDWAMDQIRDVVAEMDQVRLAS